MPPQTSPEPPDHHEIATALTISSAVMLGVSATVCLASGVFAPGWDSIACGAGVLRSWGHLQVVGASAGGVAARMPQGYGVAAGCVRWTLLDFMPESATSWLRGLSWASKVGATLHRAGKSADIAVHKHHAACSSKTFRHWFWRQSAQCTMRTL